ncbi:2-nitropropane dioxygenase [Atractiella rhizophila]|nr:2-nitropropane dioxygenase [Atractiella rhizophila]
MALRTRLTTLLEIKTPVVSAAMLGPSGGELAAQVSLAGGFGFMAVRNKYQLTLELTIARSHFPTSSILPIGVGTLAWILEQMPLQEAEELITECAKECKAIWLSNGAQIGRWIEVARKARKEVLIFVQINSVQEATEALEQWKVDVIVAQGIEAGGHGSGSSPPLLSLIPSINDSFGENRPPLLAAGGLVHGAHLAALLGLGADGIVLGTRFCLASESLSSPGSKRALVSADHGSTVRTMKFDIARGTLGWPEGVDGRGLKNRTIGEWESLGEDEIKSRLGKAIKDDDSEWTVIWAGTGVGSMKKIEPAADIVREVHKEAVERLRVMQGLLV